MGNGSKKKWWLGVLVLVGVSLLIKLSLIVTGRFVFSWDFARDMLWLRKLTVAHEPMLVGAWGSLQGTLFGALYFYLLLIPGIMFRGDPRGAVVMVTVLLSFIPLIIFSWGRGQFGTKLGLLWALLFILSPLLFRLSVYSFPQQLVPLVFLGFFIAQWEVLVEEKYQLRWVFGLGLLVGLLFHFEPANAPAALLWGLLVVGWSKRKVIRGKMYLAFGSYLIGGLLPLLPNMVYDIRHDGVQLNAYVRLLTGIDESLGGYLPVGIRLIDRFEQFSLTMGKSLMEPELLGLMAGLLILGLVFLLRRKGYLNQQPREMTLLGLLLANIGFQLGYFIAFTRLLKDYYLHFLPILTVLLVGLWLYWLRSSRWRWIMYGWLLLMAVLDISMVVRLWQSPGQAQEYRVQTQVVDWVYQQAQSQPFTVYTYSQVVHDYPYQYLFSWYGNSIYGYIPVEYANGLDQPEYVLTKEFFDQGKETRSDLGEPKMFAILEPGDHVAYSREFWLSTVETEDKKAGKTKQFKNGIEVRMYEAQSGL